MAIDTDAATMIAMGTATMGAAIFAALRGRRGRPLPDRCPWCLGSGSVTEHTMGPSMMPFMRPCRHCGGSGKRC
jgi:hypothetical protein